jgi:hypothetical protein
MAATLPVDSVWTRKTTRLCCLSSGRPLVVSSCQLVVASRIASRRPLIAPPSRHLDAPAGCRIASCRLLVAPPFRPLVAPAGCCVASQRAALSSSRHIVVPPLVISSRQLVVASSSLFVLWLHRPLVLSSCWLVVALPLQCCHCH